MISPVLLPVFAAALILCALFVFFVPEYFYRLAVRRSGEPAPLPSWLNTAGYEPVSIQSHDGLTLRGRYIAAAGSAVTVILAHGYHGDGGDMAGYARLFHERFRYNLLIPDARGHGLSGGAYTGFGWHERLDCLRWIGWVRERPLPEGSGPAPGEKGIVLFGVSMGAATVMMASGEGLPPEVKAVIEDCGYTSAEEELRYQLKRTYRIPGSWVFKAAERLTLKRHGYSFGEASAVEQIKKTRTPTLFIHGDADDFVPFKMVYALYDACPGEKDLYIAKGAGHGLAYETNPVEYGERIARFLGKYLPGPEQTREPP